ncbi:carbohydrate esterase family 9 protein [Thermothelomyces thermophilus ATCC 42464]|uniref:Carbohydrate esterase family 9 protein n=1 Tax=Thermothelomyces thermophilus (strain ATCC 42464 / BCRC 31852 / DSM 1799) TaxID=573729 RepID=G2QEU0_THET4|nr:carbohydrate esterase family 9 protein [Thermothelomyces thermophilus ATCC 42464]AEO58969.1 carbohydrate esterase family 9 protein [Thermothelomyces thermophilus ATCC 42464]
MPSAIRSGSPRHTGITKLTNCRLVRGDELVWDDIWVSSATGKIIRSQSAFYDELIMPDEVVDLGGRIVSPGFIECQLNGAYGFNFSTMTDDMSQYGKQLRDLNKKLARTGVTSYVPTVTSQTSELYKKVLPYLGPSGSSRRAHDGAESLGAHVEGPFLNPTKNGVHNTSVLRVANSLSDLEDMYGAANITPSASSSSSSASSQDSDSSSTSGPEEEGKVEEKKHGREGTIPIKMITAAPELGAMTSLIPALASRGIVVSIGHSEATYEQASAAVAAGATMITHLFNAMRPLHHRNPGIFGVLGAPEPQRQQQEQQKQPTTPPPSPQWQQQQQQQQEQEQEQQKKQQQPPKRPYFGLIADGIHLHPATVKIAWHAHPAGLVLVTDAMHMVGLPDGRYPWTNGEGEHFIVKKGSVLELEGTGGVIAGSSITLVECVSNFLNYTGATVPEALRAVTATPAAMLGLEVVKGCLEAGADADLVVLSENNDEGGRRELVVDEVWKFGVRIFERGRDC